MEGKTNIMSEMRICNTNNNTQFAEKNTGEKQQQSTYALLGCQRLDLGQDNSSLNTSILSNLHARCRHGLDEDIGSLSLVLAVHSCHNCISHLFLESGEASSSTGDDAELPSTVNRVQSILVSKLLVLELGLGGSTDLNTGNTTTKSSDTLSGLLSVEIGLGSLGLPTDLSDTSLNGLLLSAVSDNGRQLLGNNNALGSSQHISSDGIKSNTNFLSNVRGAGGNGNVLQIRLPAITETRGLDGNNVQNTTHLVDNERRKSLAGNILSDNENRLLGLDKLLEKRNNLVHIVDLGIGNKDAGRLHLGDLTLLILHKVGGDVAAIDGKTLGEFNLVNKGLTLLNDGGTSVSNLIGGLGDNAAHINGTRGDGGNILQILNASYRLSEGRASEGMRANGDGVCENINKYTNNHVPR
mmetsp:Transcript_4537/g.12804  ORF Transcript_4537/g.12804 Transcript_4537/m.12804 type:complete len:411 (-) Transcript_4537:728-1960(-)